MPRGTFDVDPSPVETGTPRTIRLPDAGGTPALWSSHLPALDGLRGIAILLVLAYHFVGGMAHDIHDADKAMYYLLRAGWIGVDLFFVLSGFLITGILLDAKGSPAYFRSFYARRILRIFPLYYGFLLVLFVILPLIGAAPDDAGYRQASHDQIWLWTYLSNVLIATGGEWTGFRTEHFWSLAIEEQFYLIWPAIVLLLTRRGLIRACIGLMFVALALRIGTVVAETNNKVPYVLTPTRIDALAMGALLAAIVRGRLDIRSLLIWTRRGALIAGLGIATMFIWNKGLWRSNPALITIGYSLLAVLFGSILIVCVTTDERSPLYRLTTNPFLRMCGKYSYAMYVLHPMIAGGVEQYVTDADFISIGGTHVFGRCIFILICTAATIFAAFGSWHLYEKHFLKLKRFFPYRATDSTPKQTD